MIEAVLVLFGIYAVAAVGMNLVYITGQLNLGQAGFLAVGAYTASIVDVELGWPLPLSLLAGAGAAALVALPVALGSTRLHGVYLIMGTLAVGEVVRVTIANVEVVGGVQGYSGMGGVTKADVFATLAAILVVAAALMASPKGLQMRSLFDDEDAAAAAGVATRRIKILAVMVSAGVVGIAGGLLAKWFLFIAPRNFGVEISFQIALFTLIGGVHSLLGALVGAATITLLIEGIKALEDVPGLGANLAALEQWRVVILGGLVMVLMWRLPEGIVGRPLALLLTRPFRALRARLRRADAGPPEAERPMTGEVVLQVEDVSHRFGGVRALRGVSMKVRAGEIVALIGANGAGKTTLVDVVAGRYRCQEGAIRLLGRDVTAQAADRRARHGICRTFQAVRVFAHLTVEETLRLGRWAGRGRSGPSVASLVNELGFEQKRDALPRNLTLREQRLVEIGRAMAAAPHVVFLDEPSAGMNESERAELAEVIRSIQAQGTSVVLVDHNLDLAFGVADRTVLLDFGEVLAEGPPDEMARDPRFREAYLGSADAGTGTPPSEG